MDVKVGVDWVVFSKEIMSELQLLSLLMFVNKQFPAYPYTLRTCIILK